MRPIQFSNGSEGRMSKAATAAQVAREERSRVAKYNGPALGGLRAYKYPKLQSMQRRIRLLKLTGGGLENPEIVCKLFEVEFGRDGVVRDPSILDHNGQGRVVEYEALSWCWGTEGRELGIRMIGKEGRAFRHPVTRELALALKYLRGPQDRILWIDAICINQEDHEERNHQVQMMALIYNSASRVCVWLGEDSEDSSMAILFVREIMKLENFDSISENKDNASKWQSLLLLMQRPWFSRRWVVQEIALARRATIYCGKDELAWENFAVAVELFVEVETATHRLSEVMKKTEAFGHVPQWFEHVSELGASVLVQATGKVFRRDGGQGHEQHAPLVESPKYKMGARRARTWNRASMSQIRDIGAVSTTTPSPPRPLLSLEYLVSSLSIFQATQPRDAVYSLLAISRDTSPLAELSPLTHNESEEAIIMATVSSFLERKPFRVDYSRPYSDVCKDFIAYCIERAKSSDPARALDILCRPWAPEPPTMSSSAGGVTHKKPIRYKYLKTREGLWQRPTTEPRMRRARRSANAAAWTRDNLDSEEDALNGNGYSNGVQHQPRNERSGSTSQSSQPSVVPREMEHEVAEEELLVADERTTKEYFDEAPEYPNYDEWRRKVDDALPGRLKPPLVGGENGEIADRGSDDEDDGISEQEEEEERDLGLPSWVSSISGAAFALFHHPGMHSMMRMGRKNADPLVGLPVDGHRNYSAAQNTKVDHKKLKFRKRQILEHHSLYASGFILDEIEEVAEPARLGAIPKTWPKLAGWEDAVDGESDPPAEFWRTLVADRGKDNRNPPYYYATACKESVKKGGLTSGSVDTGALISSERNSIIAEFCRRVQAVIWNRRLIKTKGNRLGLASEDVKPGDLVCIIFGCTVPVILRRGKVKTDEEIEEEAFVDRIEAMRVCMARLEHRCFQRLRYEKFKDRLEDEDRELYVKEIKEEQKAINDQLASWKKEDEEAAERKQEEDRAKRERKEEAENRVKKRNYELKKRQTNLQKSDFANSTSKGESKSGYKNKTAGKTLKGTGKEPTDLRNALKGCEIDQKETEKHQKKAEREDPKLWYKLHGEAYIHGMMDGEAIRERIMEGIPERLFEIRPLTFEPPKRSDSKEWHEKAAEHSHRGERRRCCAKSPIDRSWLGAAGKAPVMDREKGRRLVAQRVGTTLKKRTFSDGPKGRGPRPSKKQRQINAYHSSSSEGEDDDNDDAPLPPNLLDSDDDEDLDNIEVDDGASTDSNPDSDSDSDTASQPQVKTSPKPKKQQQKEFVAKDAPDSSGDDFSDDERDEFSDIGSHSGSDAGHSGARDTRSKRNDPEAMQTAMLKILSSKTPASRRADPIVARSADAAKVAQQVVDAALETKARKRLREQKRLAKEKGRVRDVLVASTTRTLNIATGEIEEKIDDDAETTGQILATERRLRKVAQRGVVKLFNAVRAAQVKAVEAQRVVKKEGLVGVKRKEEKVTEMSKKGFLDLIASGGGGLKKGGLEEA
ncbi:hypothetical protein B0T16DRAFT_387631 [Cercophora newfieldiana]|uniref:Heterokaryon incompatibility domain-containing protein n=1 Tax=Cercophora newfieldiana TaxID=92897 RepID=A0AA39YGS4_9PEZI|nr:hypothetical protein B0T16DRAFT_387631 [Cercophora newfieldiana]